MLVQIEGKKGEERLVVSSRQVAKDFNKRHSELCSEIEKTYSSLLAVKSPFFVKREYVYSNSKQVHSEYLMNRDGFSLLVMGFTGENTLDLKLKYIAAFNEMEAVLNRIYEERKQWEIEKAKGILVRHILSDTIKSTSTVSSCEKFDYPLYTNLIYKILFDKDIEELKAEFKIQKSESVRDYLTKDELAKVENLEKLTAGLINIGWGYDLIKQFLYENVSDKYRKDKLMRTILANQVQR